ncbi:MAG: Abi family protein, partial [Eggerthellaceae bacterium]|nr:Abi family protein [Eggerthellaceae bacterium]
MELPEATEPQHEKPMLTIEEQIARLKSKGITFELCEEDEAAAILAKQNNYLRITSYRQLYDRQTEGANVGDYINLDFGDLAALSSLDRKLRETFLTLTVDVEHFAKMKVLANVESRGENGYAIVDEFYASLNHAGRNAILGAMHVRGGLDERRDAYAGDLIAHHMADMPVWVFLEVIDFGTFVNFYLFCANRWEDNAMLQEHYALKSVKALRNATAHNHCIVNGFTKALTGTAYDTPQVITESLNAAGMPRTKTRRAKLGNVRIAQMAASMYCLNALC